MTRKSISRFVNSCLSPMGLRVIKVSTWTARSEPTADLQRQIERCQGEFNYLAEKYSEAVEEVHGYFSSMIFPELPPREGRLKLMTQLTGTQPSEAMYVLWYLHQTVSLVGDVCEFGVARGTTSALLANEILPTAPIRRPFHRPEESCGLKFLL